jgi:hypothetical protein
MHYCPVAEFLHVPKKSTMSVEKTSICTMKTTSVPRFRDRSSQKEEKTFEQKITKVTKGFRIGLRVDPIRSIRAFEVGL